MIYLTENKRYTVYIGFKQTLINRTPPIRESFKTLSEALEYRNIIDDTVSEATITDNVNGKVLIWK